MLVVCVVELVAGAGAPGLSTCPAGTETASVRLRIVTAHICRKDFTLCASLESCKNFAISIEASMGGLAIPCKGWKDYVRFALGFALFSFHQSKKQIRFMSLRASLLRELEQPNLSVDRRVELCCDLTRELENRGEYEEARKVLSDYWPRIGEAPKVAGLEESTAAELLLRAGVLTGIIGAYRPILHAQETAKDLLTQSHTIFESRQVIKKIAEARTELALCYWRTDDLDEARDCLKQALALLPIDSELKAKALLRLSIVEHAAEHDRKAFRILTKYEPLFRRLNNDTLKGCYFTTLGNRLENLAESGKRGAYIDRALIEYAAASYHLGLAGHRQYLANVETNLGYLYFKINRYAEANTWIGRAGSMCASKTRAQRLRLTKLVRAYFSHRGASHRLSA